MPYWLKNLTCKGNLLRRMFKEYFLIDGTYIKNACPSSIALSQLRMYSAAPVLSCAFTQLRIYSAAHIDILHREAEARISHQLYHRLQIIQFFTGYPHQVIHDLCLNFHPGILDGFNDLFCVFLF